MTAAEAAQTLALIKKLRASDKPLEKPDIVHDIVNDPRYHLPTFLKNYLEGLQVTVPVALGLGGLASEWTAPEAGETISSIPQAIKALLSAKERSGPTVPELRPPGGMTMMEHLPGGKGTAHDFGMGKTVKQLPAREEVPFKSALQKLYPGIADKTEHLSEPPLVEPLKAPTGPIKRIEAYNPEGRWHGTEEPISAVKHSLDVPPVKGQMMGPGLYTTNNQVIAGDYANIFEGGQAYSGMPNIEAGGPGSVRYRIHQITPVRWIDGDQAIPPKVKARLIDRIRQDYSIPELNREYFVNQLQNKKLKPMDWAEDYNYMLGRRGRDGWALFHEAAGQEGYGGLRHRGGIGGGPKHKVKIYWYPQEQVRLRPEKYAIGEARKIPELPSNPIRAPKPKYVRDPLKTKKLPPIN